MTDAGEPVSSAALAVSAACLVEATNIVVKKRT